MGQRVRLDRRGVILGLNFWLVSDAAIPWVQEAPWHLAIVIPVGLVMLGLLRWVAFAKHLPVP